MGAWGHEAFANDLAIDWTYDLEGSAGLDLVCDALDAVFEEDDYVDAGIACEALAACEVIARLKGNWGRRDSYSETADRWVEQHSQKVPGRVVRRALKAIDRILDEDSELRELWQEGDAGDDWKMSVLDLRRRVEA